MEFDLNTASGKEANDVVIVTGAAKGIGRGIAAALAGQGRHVTLFDLDQVGLKETGELLTSLGTPATEVPVDVTDAGAVDEAVEAVIERFGRVDALVNNAGIVRDKRITKMSEDDWDTVIGVNLKSQFLCCRAVLPHMITARSGRIVNISSRAWLGGVGQANYSAAKGGVVSLTRSLALEWASKGITVNAIAPGIIETPLFRTFEPELQERLKQSVPARRIGTPDDIANAVSFFLDPRSSYVTGQTLYVCGGRSLSSPSV
jgi:3-oxoacyl-[acyl-carrier protein] reductase